MNRTLFFFNSILFFTCGFSVVTIIVLSAYLKEALDLNWEQAAVIQAGYFLGYLIFCPIIGFIFNKNLNQSLLQIALGFSCISVSGVLWGARLSSYPLIAFSVFGMGSAMAVIHTVATPLAFLQGGASRVTLMQAMMSLGQISAPILGAFSMLAVLGVNPTLHASETPFDVIFFLFFLLFLASFGNFFQSSERSFEKNRGAFPYKIALIGVLAMVLAMGAEVCEASFLVPLISQSTQSPLAIGGYISSLYWFSLFAGRLFGAWALHSIKPARLMFLYTFIGTALSLTTAIAGGLISAIAAICLGFSASILFPIVFSLVLLESPSYKRELAGLLLMTNGCGGLLAYVMGRTADVTGLQISYLLVSSMYVLLMLLSIYFIRRQIKVESHI